MFATEHYVFNRQMCRCYRSGVVYFGTARRDSFGSGQGGRDCAAKKREDDKTTGPPGATNPQAATGRPHLADDREGVRGHHRAGHYRPGERRPGDILCPLRRQGDAPGQPARGPTGHAGAATTTSTYDAGRTTRARSEEHTSELQSQSNLVCRLLLEKKHYFGEWAYSFEMKYTYPKWKWLLAKFGSTPEAAFGAYTPENAIPWYTVMFVLACIIMIAL